MADKQKHICGRCNGEFASEQEYIDHLCPETGFTPKEPEHLGEKFARVSQIAVERGAERVKLEKSGMSPEKAQQKAREIVNKKYAVVR